MNNIERTLPNALEAEAAVLGAMMLDSKESCWTCRQELIAEHFYSPSHRTIFIHIVTMLDATGGCDLIGLTHRLREAGLLDELGGVAYITDLTAKCPTTAYLDHWLDLIRAAHLKRLAIDAGTAIAKEAFDLQDTDPVDWLTAKALSLSQLGESRRSPTQPACTIANTVAGIFADRWNSQDGIIGQPTGFADLDTKLKGLRPGQLIALAGHRSDGKTALACNIAANIAARGLNTCIFSLEMTREEIFERMISIRAGFDLSRFNHRQATIADRDHIEKVVEELKEWPLLINDRGGQTASTIAAEARRQAARGKLDLIIIDYLQLITWPTRAETSAVAIGENARTMKAIAKDCGCPVLLLSQLNRADLTTGSRPELHHLRGSGEIEESADAVLLLSGKLTADELPECFGDLNQHEVEKLMLVDVAKHRNGQTGPVFLRFDRPTQRFQNVTSLSPERTKSSSAKRSDANRVACEANNCAYLPNTR